MPTYEYRCQDCRELTEVQQSFTDDPLTVCPSCGGTLKKKFSSVGISFKGSGFYKTDSRSSSSSASGDAGSAKSDKSEKSEKSDTPAKSEAKSDKGDSSGGSSKKSESSSSTPAAASA
jgi:putative FmdB family regulatory protein